jgi:hypothetical protein
MGILRVLMVDQEFQEVSKILHLASCRDWAATMV